MVAAKKKTATKSSSTRTKKAATRPLDATNPGTSGGGRGAAAVLTQHNTPSTSTPTQVTKPDVFTTTHKSTAKPSNASTSSGMSSLHLQAMLENFQLEADAQLRVLRKKQQFRLEAMRRHWQSAITNLDPRLRSLSLARFLDEFEGDPETALRAIVLDELQQQQQQQNVATTTTEGTEKGARKRKRAVGASPSRATHDAVDEQGLRDASHFPPPEGSIKKPRSTAGSGLGLGNPKRVPPSSGVRSVSGKRTLGAHGSPSTTMTSARQTRQQTRPPLPTTTTTTTFKSETIYRVRPSTSAFHPHLPTTPHAQGKARAPKRGESIVLRSINDSPLLGELIAEGEEDEDDEEEGDGEWSMISPPPPVIASGKGQGVVKVAKGKNAPPSKKTFSIELPLNAPIYSEEEARRVREQVEKEMKSKMVEELKRKLDETVHDRGERERLLGVLNGW